MLAAVGGALGSLGDAQDSKESRLSYGDAGRRLVPHRAHTRAAILTSSGPFSLPPCAEPGGAGPRRVATLQRSRRVADALLGGALPLKPPSIGRRLAPCAVTSCARGVVDHVRRGGKSPSRASGSPASRPSPPSAFSQPPRLAGRPQLLGAGFAAPAPAEGFPRPLRALVRVPELTAYV